MYGEFSLYGVFIPTLLGLMLIAYLLHKALHFVLARLGVYRHVWHPPLFDLALYLLVLGALFVVMRRVQA